MFGKRVFNLSQFPRESDIAVDLRAWSPLLSVMLTDILDHVGQRSTGEKNLINPSALHQCDIILGNRSATTPPPVGTTTVSPAAVTRPRIPPSPAPRRPENFGAAVSIWSSDTVATCSLDTATRCVGVATRYSESYRSDALRRALI